MGNQFSDQRNVFRSMEGPSWRWRLAIRMVQSSFECPGLADETVNQAKRFLEWYLSDGGNTHAVGQQSKIAAAKTLWDDIPSKQQFNILTLGDVPREDIAKRLAVPVETVKTTELLFFDIREMRQATDWINIHVMLDEEKYGTVELATKYRAAFWGGPLVAQTVLDAEEHVSLDEVHRLADQELLLHMKARQALEIPLDGSKSALKLIKIYTDFEYKKQQLELLKERFRHHCEQDIRKHELAARRVDVAMKRAEAREKEEQQKTQQKNESRQEKENVAESRADGQIDMMINQQQAAIDRAANSPLAQLSWSSGTNSDLVVSMDNQAESAEQLVEDSSRSAA